MTTMFYVGTHGPDDPTRATMPFHMAMGALDAGFHPQVLVAGDATYVMKDKVAAEVLACAVQEKYTEVATAPERGFHFHTGYPLAAMLGYPDSWVRATPEAAVVRFAGVGNPFRLGPLPAGATVLDVGSGAGFD